MSTSPTATPQQVGILVLDDNAQGASAVKQILDSEGWRVRVVSDTKMLLAELKTGEWSLVIANVVLTGVDGHAFVILRELASVSAADGARIRDRKSTRLNSSHSQISHAVFCLKKKNSSRPRSSRGRVSPCYPGRAGTRSAAAGSTPICSPFAISAPASASATPTITSTSSISSC